MATSFEWLGAIFGLLGAYLLASNTRLSRWGWVAFSVSNLFMIAFALLIERHGLLVQSLGFAGSSTLGLCRSGYIRMPDMTSIYHRIYLYGYSGNVPPRIVRRLFARTEAHKAWLAGVMGIYSENGFRKGVLDRSWTFARK